MLRNYRVLFPRVLNEEVSKPIANFSLLGGRTTRLTPFYDKLPAITTLVVTLVLESKDFINICMAENFLWSQTTNRLQPFLDPRRVSHLLQRPAFKDGLCFCRLTTTISVTSQPSSMEMQMDCHVFHYHRETHWETTIPVACSTWDKSSPCAGMLCPISGHKTKWRTTTRYYNFSL